ncbi:MAG: endonuclease MutS2 [Treponema sp.]|jgi:DNA mismatch repair protein MutS2|nr:endonuclease MutS2 [Treponema sp.]
MNERTYRLLEYGEIKNRLGRCALSGEAARIIRDGLPLDSAEEVEILKTRVSAILDLMKREGEEPRESLPSILPILPKLAVEGACLEIEEAYALGIFVERAGRLAAWLLKAPGVFGDTLSGLPDCSALALEIFKIIDRDGQLRDLDEFRAIKRRIARLREELEAAVGRYTGNEDTRRMLQSPLPSQRDGRLVLAVKANFRGRIRGIVHEVSATGQTIFVEPGEVVERNNDILIEQRALDAEILRVLRILSARIAETREDLAALRQGIVELEVLRAKARYSLETGGSFAAASPLSVVLREARHPLLDAAVPIDLVMAPGIRTVIITGPNTGGKTVALKILGLFALMNQSGLALPTAEGSSLPVFDGVYADIGDEQSLSQSLSTFSGHIMNIAAITAAASPCSLVLLDELGSGTDPEEGSAIAMAILDHLIEKKTWLVVTTHHGVLKNYGYTREAVENASMEFDGRTLCPTFRIRMGVPGESRALDIAARNGLSPAIVEKARSYLAEERADVSALIRGLRDKHRELDSGRDLVRSEELRLREEGRKADLRELRLRQKEAELKEKGLGQLGNFLSESRKTLENLVRELREAEITREKTLKVKEFLAGLEAAAARGDRELEDEKALLAQDRDREKEEQEPSVTAAAPALQEGAEVLAGLDKRRGRVLRPDRKKKGNWIVEIGSLKLSVDGKELVPLSPSPAKPCAVSLDLVAPAGVKMELSLRGMRLEEALEALRRQIDGAVLSGLREFAVVHGKGEGILMKGVHEYLRNERAVADYYFSRPELGGAGRTEVILKP